MINCVGRVGDLNTLRRLDARKLERKEKFGYLDGQTAAYRADAGFGRQVIVELVLQRG